MKSIAVTLAALAATATLGACAPVPMPESYPLSYQKKMQAAHHWDLLAMHVAQRLLADADVLIYNAGGFQMGGILELDPADYLLTISSGVDDPAAGFSGEITRRADRRGVLRFTAHSAPSAHGNDAPPWGDVTWTTVGAEGALPPSDALFLLTVLLLGIPLAVYLASLT